MKKWKLILVSSLFISIFSFIYYYITLPAISIHSAGLWWFIIIVFIIASAVIGIGSGSVGMNKRRHGGILTFSGLKSKLFTLFCICTTALILIFIFGSLFSSPILNSKKYQELIQISDGNFVEDIEQISYNEIPLLDKASAELIGSRKMGGMVEYISQFEVASDYTQINYKNIPVRVTPLEYGSILKWFTNRSKGIPAYIRIDMATQDAECVKLESGMRYTKSDHFGRNIYRYLRFRYPTYIFDNLSFEIDDEDTPYWVCPVKDYTIGLFGGETIKNVILVNAITGDHINYKVEDVPSWIDRVYSADLLISYYNYYGTLSHGYWNSILSQRDCLKTTEGYNYIANHDDVWVYTGVTSVGGDESNVGFVLMNQRTAETKYYPIPGAEEYSAMSSAEGKVQHLGYQATFPLLLNLGGEPTYFICLKDSAGLVKQYAMVNISKYTIVAIGDSVTECEKDYAAQLKANNINTTNTDSLPTVTGVIKRIAESVVDGNSHYYILLEGYNEIYDVSVVDLVDIIKYEVGSVITMQYTVNEKTNIVVGLK